MLRILVLVTDLHLSTALCAALQGLGSRCAAHALDPDAVVAALRAADWDVCVADAAFAPDLLADRRGRGLVLLRSDCAVLVDPEAHAPGAAVVLQRIPCSVAALRDAVRSAAESARLVDANAG